MKVAALLARHGIVPKRRLGQHFLTDDRVAQAIAAAAGVEPGERILEIGPGVGSLTRALCAAGASVVAIEIDRSLEPALREAVAGLPVELIWGDALRVPLPPADKVVANLPYGITGPAVMRCLTSRPWERLVFMVQREVAERVLAPPGSRRYGSFTLAVRFFARAELVLRVSRGAFFPRPEVDSAVLRLWPHRSPYPQEAFFRVVRAAFSARRKTLRAALAGGLRLDRTQVAQLLDAAEIDGERRAESLSLDEFGRLAVAWHGLSGQFSGY